MFFIRLPLSEAVEPNFERAGNAVRSTPKTPRGNSKQRSVVSEEARAAVVVCCCCWWWWWWWWWSRVVIVSKR